MGCTKEIGTQVTSGDFTVPFISLIDTPKKLVTMTGICSFEILEKIIELFKINFPDTRRHIMSIKERIILVFLKLKQGMSFAILAVLFQNVTSETCRLIYTFMIPLLAQIFKPLLYWPSKQEVLNNMPYCFEKFSNTRIVLDCTEISLQKPKCLTCRIRCYSNYKSTFTLKFMIGISPGGLIVYISRPFGGRA